MKKSFGILLSAALLLTFCVSGNLAVSAAETETVVETEQQDAALKEDDSQKEQNEKDMISEEQDTEEQGTQEQDTEEPESAKDDSDSETTLDDEDISDGQTDVESDTETTDNETNDTESDEIDMTETETDTATDTESSEVETDEVSDTEVSDSETDEEESSAQEEDALAAHIETCSDDCQDENCLCSCHLFGRLMACETLEELYTLAEETPEEQLLALTEEQNVKIEEKIAELEPEPLPEVTIPESADKPVPSEIVYPTVNFSNVAPFGAPVEG